MAKYTKNFKPHSLLTQTGRHTWTVEVFVHGKREGYYIWEWPWGTPDRFAHRMLEKVLKKVEKRKFKTDRKLLYSTESRVVTLDE